MKTKLLFLFGLALLSQFGNAQQWFYYKELPVNVIPKGAASTNAGALFMLTADHKLYHKPTAGQWANMATPNIVSAEAISADRNSGRIYVGTTRQGLFFSSNNGATWGNTSLESNPVTGFREGYACFAQTNTPGLFFAGHFGTPKITVFTNQGMAGQVRTIASNPNATPSALHYTANQKLLAGTHIGIWISENNGTSFIQSSLSSGHIFSFTESGNGRAYALRRDIATQEVSLLYSDNYYDWTIMDVPQNGEKYTTLFYDAVSDDLWMGSETGIYVRYSSGNVWERKNLNNASLSVIQILGGNLGGLYNFSTQHIAQHLNNDSTAWNSVTIGLKGVTDEIVFGDNNRLFAYHNFFSNKIAALDPQSENWQGFNINTVSSGVSTVIPAGNNKVIANTFNRIYLSQDMGQTFSEIPIPQEFSIQTRGGISVLKKGRNDAILVSHSFVPQKIYGTSDEGQTWDMVSNISTISPFGSIFDFSQDSDGRLYLIRSSGNFEVYTSADGNSWQLIPYNYSDPTFSFASCSLKSIGQRTFLIGDTKLFEITHTGGNYAIRSINTPFLEGNNQMTHFKLTSEGSFIVTTYMDGVYQSDTNGNTWNSFGFPSGVVAGNSELDGIAVYDNLPFIHVNEGNAIGIPSGIYYYIKNSLSVGNEELLPSLTLYPNPVKDMLHINSRDGIISGRIIDSSGRLVMLIPKGTDSLDVSRLNEGLYFLQAETGQDGCFVEKFIKS